MAAGKKRTRKTKRTAGRPKGVPPAAAPPAPERLPAPGPLPQILDLTLTPDRPTVRLPVGDYQMRLAEELTFQEFSDQIAAGKSLRDKAEEVGDPGVLEELQGLVASAAQTILVDLDDEAAATITPGQFLKMSTFFTELATASGAPASESGSSSAPDASDSSEASAAA